MTIPPLEPPESTCPICFKQEDGVLRSEERAGTAQWVCNHGACRECLHAYVDSQLPKCKLTRQLRVACFAPECGKVLPQRLVLEVSEEACKLAEGLEKRFDLENNALYPEPVQVDCPRSGCVGMGYLGFETVMCFVCEHTWVAKQSQLQHGETICESSDPVKPCPRCGVMIEKDGGCDHMTCQCGYEFSWATLQMWQP